MQEKAVSKDFRKRSVELDDKGVRVYREQALVGDVLWSEIVRIDAHKEDLFVVDMIVLTLTTGDGRFVQVDDEMVGFSIFNEEMPRRFPGMREWFMAVAFPAFERNEMTIWEKKPDAV